MILFSANSERDAVHGVAAHLLPHQQVHQRLPGSHQCLRGGHLQGGQPGRLHHHHLPLPLRHHVRGRRPRHAHVPFRLLVHLEGKTTGGKYYTILSAVFLTGSSFFLRRLRFRLQLLKKSLKNILRTPHPLNKKIICTKYWVFVF